MISSGAKLEKERMQMIGLRDVGFAAPLPDSSRRIRMECML